MSSSSRMTTAVVKTEGLKDTGSRTSFTSGAVRDAGSGKGAPALVPSFVIWLLSRIYEDGAAKYTSRNWEKGMPLSVYINSMERHLSKLKAGMRDEPHATQLLWNVVGYVYTSALIKMGFRPKELNDMPNQLAPLNDKGEVGIAEPLSPHEYKSMKYFFDVKEFPVTF
jgi:hypothetical protein